MLSIQSVFVFFFSALILSFAYAARRSYPPGAIHPPGPKGYPIIGSLLDIPPYHSWLKFFDWSKTYGPLYEVTIAGKRHIMISSERIANDLLRERGSIYSSRQQLLMAAQIVSDGLRPLFWTYGDLWRRGRKLTHHLTMPSGATSYEGFQDEESLRLLRDLIRDPKEYETWLERYSAGLMMRIVFGKNVMTGKEEVLNRIFKVAHNIERVASPGAYLVDVFPWLMYLPAWFPGAGWKREGRRLHAEELDLFRGLQDGIRNGMASDKNGKADQKDNCTEIFLRSQEKWDLSDDEGAYVVGTLFEAGAGTTAAALMSFILAMEELDKVVGLDRLPTFDDIPQLPRVRAAIKETLRWRPVTAGNVPHLLMKDDVYELDGKRYLLEAGTNVHANQWAIHCDPSLYPDPESFIPEEPLDVHPNIQNFSAFGFGRRICGGMNIAERSLNIVVARIAWGCEIERVEGYKYGEYEYTRGFNVQPLKFPFVLKARSDKQAIIEKEYGKH